MLGQALLSSDTRNTAGILLLAIVAVEFGGTYMLRILRGRETVTGFQHAFARAGTRTPVSWSPYPLCA